MPSEEVLGFQNIFLFKISVKKLTQKQGISMAQICGYSNIFEYMWTNIFIRQNIL